MHESNTDGESSAPREPARSLWALTAPRIPDDDALPPAATDVLIAGAGLSGLALADMLTTAGIGVVVVEARGIGDVTTGNTTGKASLLQGTVIGDLSEHVPADVVASYIESNRAALDWLRARFDRHPEVAISKDAVTYARTDPGVAALDREYEALVGAGVDVERISGPGDLGLPFDVVAALRLPDQIQLQPMRLLGALASDLRAKGVRIVTGCRLAGADTDDRGVDVATNRGIVRCGRLVLATGAPVLDRGLFFAKLTASRSFVAAYSLPPGIAGPQGMFLSTDGDSRSLRVEAMPGGSRALVVGGGVHPTGRFDHTATLRDELDAWTAAHWPDSRRITWWAAQDYRMVTRVPYAGPLPRGGGRIYAATGFNKWGMTNAVASALRLSGILCGTTPPWDAALARRHAGLASALDATRAGASVGGHLIADWARVAVSTDEPASGRAPASGRVVRSGVAPVAEATVEGVTTRVSAVCTHLGGIVSWNEAECSWDCPLHGSRFDREGRVLEGPATRDLLRHDT